MVRPETERDGPRREKRTADQAERRETGTEEQKEKRTADQADQAERTDERNGRDQADQAEKTMKDQVIKRIKRDQVREENGGLAERTEKASPLASITMHKLLLYTTNHQWQVVNLKEARDFSNDLLPHPDMFLDASLTCSDNGAYRRDDDGAKRVFFGGERFLEGISGEAYITIQRTELNSPLGLEVQLHVPEAVCPALSEPGLRALLRFMTGFYVCLNRGDVDQRASQASVSDGENTKNLSRITLGGLFLRQGNGKRVDKGKEKMVNTIWTKHYKSRFFSFNDNVIGNYRQIQQKRSITEVSVTF
ncbi:hypothetical protein Sjap_003352 [Stephania japonica]|uniref:Uncharacterized protein n=1 Tax=Stephania japonica TaxID=461633 RepID=A0AAP0PTH9_9MAGN